MNISFGQILVILIVGFLLFGNLPTKVEQWSKAFTSLREFTSKNSESSQTTSPSEAEGTCSEKKKDSSEAKPLSP
jgi:Sec-independent protein translocase protein TatA